jgi:hypothetical protein
MPRANAAKNWFFPSDGCHRNLQQGATVTGLSELSWQKEKGPDRSAALDAAGLHPASDR